MSVLVYALGGGFGHVVRGAALAAAFERNGTPASVLVPETHLALATALGASGVGVGATRDPVTLRRHLDAAIEQTACTLLVVDSFPAGLLGELADPPCVARRALLLRLHRDADAPAFLRAAAAYDHVLDLEPHLDWRPPDLDATPFGAVAREPSPDALATADVLLVATDALLAPLLLRLARRLARNGRHVQVAVSGGIGPPDREPRPALPLTLGRDAPRVVVGAAGYNLVYEACAADTAHLAVPLPRRFDNQHLRARTLCEIPGSPEALERRVLELLDGASFRRRDVSVQSHEALALRLAGA